MTNAQKWTTIILSFIAVLFLVTAGWSYGILNSPAATSKIDIDADMWFEMSEYGELQLQSIHLNRIQGEVNSKILDILLLLVRSN